MTTHEVRAAGPSGHSLGLAYLPRARLAVPGWLYDGTMAVLLVLSALLWFWPTDSVSVPATGQASDLVQYGAVPQLSPSVSGAESRG